ncbi:ParB/Srx family N-terminal domain-containing protein [Aliikangiella coralliicola]|uniref:ParB/Sulfiredoxin domain-containing protein n=1 Tax=Aliikangiella coralliicola TaxID=2592383 RepID=A0A545U4D3_9GAMM|nr:ParB/Srx family N-terminal domain-containing protein [Aliikangiella coralliicola]TQV84328.1 hypothetical protein FLL46_22135 [Aliikangiella coralliicola]
MNDPKYDQLLVSSLNNQEKKLHTESFTYQSIFLSSIVPDSSNARFLPAVLIEDEDAKLFVSRKMSKKQLVNMYNAEDHVIIGKSCIVNCLEYGSADWKKANQTIESILELGDNISVSELIQAPTIYPVGDSKYQVLTGHRRFFALVYAKGYGSAAQFKLYESKPLLTKVKQFQENASREDLPQYGKLAAFVNAMAEIEALSAARIKVGLKKLTVKETATSLGISMGAFDNYNVLTRYPCVLDLYQAGLSYPFVKTKKVVLEVESDYKAEHDKSVLNITDKKKIAKEIESRLFSKEKTSPPRKNFQLKPIKSAKTIKSLLTTNVMELDTGINWDDIDWDDHFDVSKTISTVIEYLEKAQ